MPCIFRRQPHGLRIKIIETNKQKERQATSSYSKLIEYIQIIVKKYAYHSCIQNHETNRIKQEKWTLLQAN